MKGHLISLRAFSDIFLGFSLPLVSFSNIVLADDSGDLISKVEASSASAANEASILIDILRSNVGQESTSAGKLVGPLDKGDGNGETSSNQGSLPRHIKPQNLARKYPIQEALKDIQLPHEGKGKCKDNASESSGKCSSSLLQGLEAKQALSPSSNTQLLIFVSQSVPASSIKELWSQAQRMGGKLLFRGLVGGSFKETQSYIQELGIIADIDPTKFDEFEVTHVPSFVFSKGGKYDKMVGNISLTEFLEQSSISGDLKKEAADLLKSFEGSSP